MKTERERETGFSVLSRDRIADGRERRGQRQTDRQSVRERERPRYRQTENYVVWFTTTFRKGSKKLRDWSELRGRHLLRRFLNGDPPSSRPLCAFSLTLPFFLFLFFFSFFFFLFSYLLSHRQPRWDPIILCLTQPML